MQLLLQNVLQRTVEDPFNLEKKIKWKYDCSLQILQGQAYRRCTRLTDWLVLSYSCKNNTRTLIEYLRKESLQEIS